VAFGGALFMVPLTALAFLVQPGWVETWLGVLSVYLGWAGFGPHLLQSAGPFAYAGAQIAAAIAGIWLLRRRTVAEAAAFSLALTVILATVAGAYSGALALPALVLAADDLRYTALPALAGFVGWVQVAVLQALDFPVGVVAYWFVLQAYPLLRRPLAADPIAASYANERVNKRAATLGAKSSPPAVIAARPSIGTDNP
jgi:hypothetical protein